MYSVNFSAKGRTVALSCGNIKFVRYGPSFIETSPDNSNACGYHGCVDHAGKKVLWLATDISS